MHLTLIYSIVQNPRNLSFGPFPLSEDVIYGYSLDCIGEVEKIAVVLLAHRPVRRQVGVIRGLVRALLGAAANLENLG